MIIENKLVKNLKKLKKIENLGKKTIAIFFKYGIIQEPQLKIKNIEAISSLTDI